MRYNRYQASGYGRDGITVTDTFKTMRSASEAFYKENPGASTCIVRRVAQSITGEVFLDRTFPPKQLVKIKA